MTNLSLAQYSPYNNMMHQYYLNYPVFKGTTFPAFATRSNIHQQTSQSDTVSFSSNEQIQTKAQKPGLSKSAMWNIGTATVLGLGALAYVLTRGKVGSKQAQQLAEHIEFKEAKSMEEAAAFAKKHLGITKFDVGNDLEMANWVNNGLTKISNKYKGKAPIPSIVETYPDELYQKAIQEGKALIIADINAYTGKMRVNTHYFNDAKKTIQKCMDAMKIKIYKPDSNGDINFRFGMLPFMNLKKQADLLPLLVKVVDGKATKMDLVNCQMAIYDMLHYENVLYKKPELIYSHVLKSNKLQKIMEAKKDLSLLSLDKFKALPKEKQIDYLYNLNDEIIKGKTGADLLNIFSEIRIADRGPNVHQVINHEMGHAFHLQSIGAKAYKKGHLLTDSEKDIATTVSNYATTNSHEFVAEVFAELVAGHTVSKEVMDLYKKFGGITIPV